MCMMEALKQAMKLAKMIGASKPFAPSVSEGPLFESPRSFFGSPRQRSPSPKSVAGTGTELLQSMFSPLRSPLKSPSLVVRSSRAELEAVFQFIDANKDGQISPGELLAVLQSLGDEPSEEELLDMVKEVDLDGDGYISLDEFISFNHRSMVSAAELRAAFHFFDINGDGFISAEELHRVLVGLGEKGLTKADCGRMISGVDVNGDGFVDFEEFKVMMAK